MADKHNRTQRREDIRRAIESKNNKIKTQASNSRRVTRAHAREINRERALRAAGIESDMQPGRFFSITILDKHRIDACTVIMVVVLLVAMVTLGVFRGQSSHAQIQLTRSNGTSLMMMTDNGALSII